jgi:hypothetical protein
VRAAVSPGRLQSEHIARLQNDFCTRQVAVVRGFIDRDLAQWIADRLSQAAFTPYRNPTGTTQLVLAPCTVSALLLMLLNDPHVFELVEATSGGGGIGRFAGRTYRMEPATNHVSHWHDDAIDSRVAALTLNLSPKRYDGGTLQVRAKASNHLVCEVDDLEFGDAALIRISKRFEHRNSLLRGHFPKTAHAGFFYPGEPSPLVRC